jgi:hypothetical protein
MILVIWQSTLCHIHILEEIKHPHTAGQTKAGLGNFNWELFVHPPYSSDLAPNSYNLTTCPKNWSRSQHFNNDKFMYGVKKWLSSRTTGVFDTGIQCNKWLNYGGGYNEGSLNTYKFFVYNNFSFSLPVLLTAQETLLSHTCIQT